MFLITQFIGLFVVNAYTPIKQAIINPQTNITENITTNSLPYGMQAPEFKSNFDFWSVLPSIIISFIIAIFITLIIAKYKWKMLIRIWFFAVIIFALGISINALFLTFHLFSNTVKLLFLGQIPLSWIISTLIVLPFAFLKIYKSHIIIHNLTELLIYPGIAAVFVPILNIQTMIVLLAIISIYDMWAVWHSGIMQKMAKFQIQELQIFGGFLVPYVSKTVKDKIKKLKKLGKLKGKKIKVSLAILGGGDVVFPIITAGIFLRAYGLVPALLITAGAFLGLLFLFIISKKGKSYPAMPFISVGMLLGMFVNFVMLYII